jgi:hypothetical protein
LSAPLATGGLACLISFVEAVPLLFSAFLPVSASLVFACYDFGLMLGYRPNSLRNFNWLPFTPPLVASSVLQMAALLSYFQKKTNEKLEIFGITLHFLVCIHAFLDGFKC